MVNAVYASIAWVVAASLLGFGISFVFADRFKLSRRVFLIPYVVLAGAFLYGFVRSIEIDLAALLRQNWIWGIVAGVIAGIILVVNVRSQPASRQSQGGELAFDLAWLGLVYGILDALFLNVMPVLAVWVFTEGATTWPGKIGFGILALTASLLVTFAYHVGYAEFRNKSVGLVLVGNAVITLAYLISGNPLGAILSHTVMHIAATIQGPETTIQLPPHRSKTLAV